VVDESGAAAATTAVSTLAAAQPGAAGATEASQAAAVDERTAASTAAGVSLWTLLREDYRTHRKTRAWMLDPGLHAMAVYRIGHWRRGLPSLLRLPVSIWYILTNGLVIKNLYGVDISDRAIIGRRVLLGHHQTVMIPMYCVVGDDTVLRHNLTIGYAGVSGEAPDAVPRIGQRVSIGPGAYLLGPITIGDDATIGPGSIITTNVPARATVFAAPARIMKPAS
jgi:serine O-acetyltransferase